MPLQPRAPLAWDIECIHQRTEQRQVADLDGECFKPCGTQGFDGQRHDLGFARGTILQPQQFHARLEELGGAVRFQRLMAENQTVVANAGGEFGFGFHRLVTDGNGEIGAQAQIAPRWIGEGEGAAADFLARTIQENIGGLEHRWLLAHIEAGAEGGKNGVALRLQGLEFAAVVIRKGGHQPFLNIFWISATRFALSTVICASRFATQVARLSTDFASSAPSARSLIVTLPLARSSPPSITAMAASRLSAYFIWSPNLPVPT